MENFIIIAILLAIIVFALLRAKKHFGGGCCSSGSNIIRLRKTLDAPQIGQKTMTIEGMTCENCGIRVENALNRLDGVASRVNWKMKKAIVAYSADVSDEQLRDAVERMGYRVISVR